MCLAMAPARAQAVRYVNVSGEKAYTEHLQLMQDSGDSDLIVKIVYDEASDMLILSLISYRNLFVFQDDVVYKKVFHGAGRLNVDKLPYPVTAEPGTKFKMPTKFRRKVLGTGYDNQTFHRWYESSGLMPVPAQYNMVNPFIEQQFTIVNTDAPVMLTLRDILMIEPSDNNPLKYNFTGWADLNLRYSITVTKNPCFGKDEELALALENVQTVRTAYEAFAEHYSSGVVDIPESMTVFEEMKSLLQAQFAVHPTENSCPDISAAWEEYNSYVEAIGSVTCTLRMPGTDPEMLYEKARVLDLYTSRWLLSGDQVEKRDIVKAATEVIREADEAITAGGLVDEEQRKAAAIYRKARDYFKTNCKNR